MDFANRDPSQYTSINKLEYENERLRRDLAKLHVNGKAAWPSQSGCDEAAAYAYQGQLKMETSGDRYASLATENSELDIPWGRCISHVK